MIGFVSENIPASGAIGLSIVGGAGMFSGFIFQPLLGRWYDNNLVRTDDALSAGQMTLKTVAILPAILIVAFGFLYFYMLRKKRINKS